MIIDEVVVNRIIYLQRAYPSKSDDPEYITQEINNYFSKEVTEQRVSILCTAMLEGKISGKMLYPYYPLFLFFSKPYRDGRKIIFDKAEQLKEIELFKQACISFGIPFHLKKHGNSEKRVFRVLPSFKELELSGVLKGESYPVVDWSSIWGFMNTFGYMTEESPGFWKIKNSVLRVPFSFWRKASSHFKVKKITKLKTKDICLELEKAELLL